MTHVVWVLLTIIGVQAYIIINAARVVVAASKLSRIAGRREVYARIAIADIWPDDPELRSITGGDVIRAHRRRVRRKR